MKWTCPCGCANDDDPTETAFPLCEQCDQERDWADIENEVEGHATAATKPARPDKQEVLT